jgi:hypothetical protein
MMQLFERIAKSLYKKYNTNAIFKELVHPSLDDCC